jgi:hypothetical protein
MWIVAVLVALGGVASAIGIENPRRQVRGEDCAGGAIIGASREAEPAQA